MLSELHQWMKVTVIVFRSSYLHEAREMVCCKLCSLMLIQQVLDDGLTMTEACPMFQHGLECLLQIPGAVSNLYQKSQTVDIAFRRCCVAQAFLQLAFAAADHPLQKTTILGTDSC